MKLTWRRTIYSARCRFDFGSSSPREETASEDLTLLADRHRGPATFSSPTWGVGAFQLSIADVARLDLPCTTGKVKLAARNATICAGGPLRCRARQCWDTASAELHGNPALAGRPSFGSLRNGMRLYVLIMTINMWFARVDTRRKSSIERQAESMDTTSPSTGKRRMPLPRSGESDQGTVKKCHAYRDGKDGFPDPLETVKLFRDRHRLRALLYRGRFSAHAGFEHPPGIPSPTGSQAAASEEEGHSLHKCAQIGSLVSRIHRLERTAHKRHLAAAATRIENCVEGGR